MKYFFFIIILFFSIIFPEDVIINEEETIPRIEFGNFNLPNMDLSFENLVPEKGEGLLTLLPFQIEEIKLQSKNYIPDPITPNDLIIISTNLGTIKFKFYNNDAPINSLNFKKLANSKFYDMTLIHNIIPRYIIQGGDILSRNEDPDDDGTGSPGWTIKSELNNQKHVRGTLSMIRGKDQDSAGSQFFISLSENNNLDGKYTIFAYLISGDSILSRISNIASENKQAKMLCVLEIPQSESIENWVELNDPITGNILFSKVPVNQKKNNYKDALQKKLNSMYRPGVPVIIDSIRIIIEND